METQTSTQKMAPRRTRNVTMTIRASQEEKDFIMKKMELSGTGNFNTYALKMLIVGEVVNVDLSHYRELAKEVNYIGTNINQIVTFAHARGKIFDAQIAGLQRWLDEIWRLLKSSLSELR